MPGVKGRSGGRRAGAGPKHKGAIEWQVNGVYTFAHMEQYPPAEHGAGAYLTFETEEEARAQVELWRHDPRFDYLCLFKQVVRHDGLVDTLRREVVQVEPA